MRRVPPLSAVGLFALLLPTAGCLFHTRPVEESYSKVALQEATQSDLIAIVNQQAQKLRSLQATVDIDTSVGGAKKGEITDYKEIRGYVLARQPAMLRMIGLLPIVRTTAFDMVSNGQEFKLWIPPKNRFVIGSSQTTTRNPDHPMENLRPQDVYSSLFIKAIVPPEIAIREKGEEILHDAKGHRVLQDDYELIVFHTKGDSEGVLNRKIVFSRVDLLPHRQYIYDEDGNLITDARYANYKEYDGVAYPTRIEIHRPQEEYDITLNILKLDMNKPLKDEQFTLEQPAGATVVNLEKPQSSEVRISPVDESRKQ
jgi:outer membrane lipoprotein-sorting protein